MTFQEKLEQFADLAVRIGVAQEMMIRRNNSLQEQQLIEQKGAVGEAFGYYFNEKGDIVHHIRTIGIQLEQVKRARKIIAIMLHLVVTISPAIRI